MPIVDVGGIRLYYEESGEGFPVVMVIGLGATLDWWGPELTQALAPHHRVVVFDNRGAGRSEAPVAPYTVPQMAEDTVGLLDRLGIQRAHLVGYSMGGMIVQEVALRHPERVARLILSATGCGGWHQRLPNPRVLRLILRQRHGGTVAKDAFMGILFPEGFRRRHPDFVDVFWDRVRRVATNERAFLRQLGAIIRWPGTYGRLPSIGAPTLVMHGTSDILVPPRNGLVLARRIPGAEFRLFEDGGHGFGFQFLDEVLDATLKFLDGGAAKGRGRARPDAPGGRATQG